MEDIRTGSGYSFLQVLATIVTDMQYFSLGSALNYAPVEIDGLTSMEDLIKPSETDISWIGSICFIMQSTGNVLGGKATEIIGRKRGMILGNVPYVLAWLTIWLSSNVGTLLLGNILLGLGTGLLAAPMISYLGEISENSTRGILVCSGEVFVAIGACAVYVLGTVVSWRGTAAIYLCISACSAILIFLLPESPIWLLAKGRKDDALKSLCWLRGWVEPSLVKKEFETLIAYNDNNNKCRRCLQNGIDSNETPALCPHINESWCQRFKNGFNEFKRIEVRRPLALGSLFFMFSATTSFLSIKPTIVNTILAFNVPGNPSWILNGLGVITILGSILCMSLVRWTGKRPIAIISMLVSFLSTLLLAIYANQYLPQGTNSFTKIDKDSSEMSVYPLVLFVVMISANSIGINPISWMIISEIFPYSVRGTCSGLAGGVADLSFFISAKTYIDVEYYLEIYGAFYLFAALTIVGTIYLYFFLVETEDKSLAEIEAVFADRNRIFYVETTVTNKLESVLFNEKNISDNISSKRKVGNNIELTDAQGHTNNAFENV